MQLRSSKHDLNTEWRFGNSLIANVIYNSHGREPSQKQSYSSLKTQAINGYTISHFTLQFASVINCWAVPHLQIIPLFANAAQLMQMPQDLTVFKSGNSKWRVINQ